MTLVSPYKQVFNPRTQTGGNTAAYLKQAYIEDGAAQFTRANSEFLSIASNPTLQTGDVTFWGAFWVYFNSVADNMRCMAKADTTAPDTTYEYNCQYSVGAGMTLAVRDAGGSSYMIVTETTLGVLLPATWYFVFFYHDAANDEIGIGANNNALDTLATAGGAPATTATGFDLGITQIPGDSQFLNGRMDNPCFGKSPTASLVDIRNWFWNGGAGRSIFEITPAIQAQFGIISGWPVSQVSGTRYDAIGSNDLSDNNSVTLQVGKVAGFAKTEDAAISQINDVSGNGNNATQNVSNSKPVLKIGGLAGINALYHDGIDDFSDANKTFQAEIRNSGFIIGAIIQPDDGRPPFQENIAGMTDAGLNNQFQFDILSDGTMQLYLEANGNAANFKSNIKLADGPQTPFGLIGFIDKNGADKLRLWHIDNANITELVDNGIANPSLASVTLNDFTMTFNLFWGARNGAGTDFNHFAGLIGERENIPNGTEERVLALASRYQYLLKGWQ